MTIYRSSCSRINDKGMTVGSHLTCFCAGEICSWVGWPWGVPCFCCGVLGCGRGPFGRGSLRERGLTKGEENNFPHIQVMGGGRKKQSESEEYKGREKGGVGENRSRLEKGGHNSIIERDYPGSQNRPFRPPPARFGQPSCRSCARRQQDPSEAACKPRDSLRMPRLGRLGAPGSRGALVGV